MDNPSEVLERALSAVYGSVPILPVAEADVTELRLAIASEVVGGQAFRDMASLRDFLGRRPDGDTQWNLINRVLIQATGRGPFSFILTDPAAIVSDGPVVTVLDYALARRAALESLEEDSHRPASLTAAWCRWLEQGRLVNGFLYTADGYLWDRLEDGVIDWIAERYGATGPSPETVIGADIDRYLAACRIADGAILETCGAASGNPWAAVYSEEREGAVMRRVVLSGENAMAKVRLEEFPEDVSRLPDGKVFLDEMISSAAVAIRKALEEKMPAASAPAG